MRIVEIRSLENGAHRNQTVFGGMAPPDGWAVIPDDMETENFPFGEIDASEIDGVLTVTAWTPGTLPEHEQETAPTIEERVANLETEAANDRAALKLLLTGEDTEATT